MKRISRFCRLIHIQYILAKHGIDRILFSTRWFSPFWFLTFFNPWNWFRSPDEDRGTAIRLALEELGPIFVKFGQVLSTRRDLLPEDIADALAFLQDNVPPFPADEARAIIEKNLKKPIDQLFSYFDNIPLAAASIAQVHGAVLPNGKSVIVKVLRPNIRKKIQQDIDVLYTLVHFVKLSRKIWRLKSKVPFDKIIHEFEISLLDEIDLRREAGNASQLRQNFSNSSLLYIPSIEWEYTNSHVMVMERIDGIPIGNREALLAYNINLPKLAARGIELFFTQVFRDSFFHADMHPGNIFVSKQHPDEPQYICVDFGIMGTLSDKDKRYIAENLYAFFHRDYRRIAELHLESGWLNEDVRLDRFESAIRTISEPIFEKSLRDISFAELFFNLIKTAKRFHINIQPQLLLLQKTLLAVEGLARFLDPDLDLWTTAKPFLERWIKQQIGLKAFLHNMKKTLPFLTQHLPEFPELLHDFLIHQNHQRSLPQLPQVLKKKSMWPAYGLGLLIGMIIGGLIVYEFF